MGSHNSQGELCSEFYSKLFADLCTMYPRESCYFKRDLRTLKRRYSNEGLELFTIAFPKLGKAVDYALEMGFFEAPEGWKRQNNSVLPEFLGSLFSRIFDDRGDLVDHDVDAIRNLRQILYFCYKLELPYSEQLTRKFLDDFVQKDNSIDNNRDFSSTLWGERARAIVEYVLRTFDFKDIEPKHGPGAVATGEKYDDKWTFKRLYRSIHSCYPYYDYFVVGTEHLRDWVNDYKALSRIDSGCAKVVLVPKDSRGPRLISCEPLELQYIQQGIMRRIVPHFEYCGPTAGTLNFTNQKVNAQLALESSISQEYCTLDLKDASDMVSQGLVKYLFGDKYKYLDATRSTHTLLPSGTVHLLNKFAPMGSAMCFPVEALCFWAICVSSISQFTGWRWQSIARNVYVYGDDIIVKDQYYGIVVNALTEAGLIVNLQKSFTSGFFRESCGTDAYRGANVTPVRLKTLWSANPEDGHALEAYCNTAGMLKSAGYAILAEYVYSTIEALYGPLPYGTEKAGYPCRLVDTYDQAVLMTNNHEAYRGKKCRLHPCLQVPQVKCKRVRKAASATKLDGWQRLLRNQLIPLKDPEQVVGAAPLKIQTRWTVIR